MYGCLAFIYICAPHACLEPMEARREHWIPWNRSFRWLYTTMCVLRIDFGSSSKTATALNWAIPPTSHFYSFVKKKVYGFYYTIQKECLVTAYKGICSESAKYYETFHILLVVFYSIFFFLIISFMLSKHWLPGT